MQRHSQKGITNLHMGVFFELTVLFSFTVHTVCNYVASANLSNFQNGFNQQCTTGARLNPISANFKSQNKIGECPISYVIFDEGFDTVFSEDSEELQKTRSFIL